MPSPAEDTILTRCAAAVRAHYGPRLERVVLYRSRARGEARADSDYDIAVFLHDPAGFYAEADALAAITTEILNETGAVISAMPLNAGSWRERTGFMHEIRKDGIDL